MLVKSQIKYIQSLGHKKYRDEEKCFIAEGPKIVTELLSSTNIRVRQVFATGEFIHEINNKNTEVIEVTEEELARISQLKTPNKVIAIAEQPAFYGEISVRGKVSLVLDTIQDPGNMGTIIRTADWFGVDQVICSEDCADVYNPKVIQATMGSIARVNVFYTDIASWLPKQGVTIYAAMLDGEKVNTMEKITEGIILIGNESRGIDKALTGLNTHHITISKKGNAESLNAAVATGIILSFLT